MSLADASDIDRLVAAFRAALEAGSAVSATPVAAAGTVPTFAELWAEYWEAEGRHLRCAKTEEGRARLHLLPYFGHLPADQVTLVRVDDYRNMRRRQVTCRGRVTTAASRNREVMRLRHVYYWAHERGKIATNPLAKVKLEKETNIAAVVIDEESLEKILSACPHEALMRALIYTAVDSGMRRGEFVLMERSRLNLETGEYQIEKEAKGGEPRVAMVTSRALAAISALPKTASRYVFAHRKNGMPPHPRTVLRWFQKGAEEAGVWGRGGARLWIHWCRHTFVTQAERRGVPRLVVQAQTGHKSDECYTRYRKVQQADLLLARATFERGIANEKKRRGPQRTRRVDKNPETTSTDVGKRPHEVALKSS